MALLSLASLLAASSLAAQEVIQPGARVRVTAPQLAPNPITGIVSAVDSASITLADAEGRAGAVIPLASVQTVEIDSGSRSHAGRGAKIGSVVGAAAGLALGIAAASQNTPGGWFNCYAGCVAAVTGGGAVWGLALGALFGAAIHSTRWEKAALPQASRTLGVSLMPRRGGVALALSMRL